MLQILSPRRETMIKQNAGTAKNSICFSIQIYHPMSIITMGCWLEIIVSFCFLVDEFHTFQKLKLDTVCIFEKVFIASSILTTPKALTLEVNIGVSYELPTNDCAAKL